MPTFAQFFRSLRQQRELALREFCRLAQADPSNISRMERGTVPPPQDEGILARYAGALGVSRGSDDWYRLVDLAAAERGVLPRDIARDAELVGKLPLVFRALRGDSPTEDELRALALNIRKAL